MKSKKLLACLFLTFLVLTVMSNSSFSQPTELVATVTTDKSSYVLRETVEIYGNVTFQGEPVDAGLIGIQVEDSRSNMISRTVSTGIGNTGNWGIEIVSFYLSDDSGNPVTEVERGEWAYFYVTVKNNKFTSQMVLITINIYDSTLIPLGLKSTILTIDSGASATYLAGLLVDEWASIGNAPAYANVYSNWPKYNGYPLCPEKTANFTIVASEYEEPPDNPIPQQPIQNGVYTINFTLASNPLPGTYQVSVCAWYFGYHSETATTTFQVEDTPAPPRASFVAKPPIASPNYTITFDASSSSPEGYNDTITSYTWDFGDGQSETGETTTHKYADFGNYTVTLNVTDLEGFWNATSKIVVIAEIHDIALTSIYCLDEIYSDWLATITIKVENKGTYAETFNVTVYYNSLTIATEIVTNLNPFNQTTLTFQWNTTGLPLYVYYTISAEADIVSNETITEDNTIIYGTIKTKVLGDFDGDRDIDIYDIVPIASLYGIESSNPSWNIQADLQPDGNIDIYDIVIATSEYGNSY